MNAHFLTTARIAAKAGARELLARKDSFAVHEKAPKDLVTEADIASQQAISRVLLDAFPDHHFVGEEEGLDQFDRETLDSHGAVPTWIVDPLDGTVNYVHQLQSYSVSIGMYHEGQLQLGVVYDPVCDELFWAQRDRGAFLNDTPIRASSTKEIGDALIACSFSPGVARDSDELTRFIGVLENSRSMRRLGSAALNLCYVASGRLDGYWASSLKPWDVAGGAIILSEALGCIRNLAGNDFDVWKPQLVATGTPELNLGLRNCFGT